MDTKLLDFGRLSIQPPMPPATRCTSGTPAQCRRNRRSARRRRRRATSYSVGVILSRRSPGGVPSGSYVEVLTRSNDTARRPPRSATVPELLDALLPRSLERRPEMRPSDAEVMTRLYRVWPSGGARVRAGCGASWRPSSARGTARCARARLHAFDARPRADGDAHGGSGMARPRWSSASRPAARAILGRHPERALLRARVGAV